MEVTFDTETIRLINLFEKMTHASVKDCLVDVKNNCVYFIIGEGEVGIAIGKGGSNVRQVEKIIKKDVKIFEFSNDVNLFVKNLIPQTNEIKVKIESGKTVIEIKVDRNSKAMVIGRDGKNVKLFKELLQRNHKISDLVVR